MAESSGSSPCQSVFNDLLPVIEDSEDSCTMYKDASNNKYVYIDKALFYCDTKAKLKGEESSVPIEQTLAYRLSNDIKKALDTAKKSSCFQDTYSHYLIDALDHFYDESNYFLNNGGDFCILCCYRKWFFGFAYKMQTICPCCGL